MHRISYQMADRRTQMQLRCYKNVFWTFGRIMMIEKYACCHKQTEQRKYRVEGSKTFIQA